MKARIPGRRALLKPDKQAVRDYVDQHQKGVKVVCLRCGLESPWALRCEGKKRREKSVERHDFGEEEGANQWMRSNAPC